MLDGRELVGLENYGQLLTPLADTEDPVSDTVPRRRPTPHLGSAVAAGEGPLAYVQLTHSECGMRVVPLPVVHPHLVERALQRHGE